MTDIRKILDTPMANAADDHGSHLAHWPPPLLGRDIKPMPVKYRASSKPAQHATRRGWRLTRAMFSEFQDDEE